MLRRGCGRRCQTPPHIANAFNTIRAHEAFTLDDGFRPGRCADLVRTSSRSVSGRRRRRRSSPRVPRTRLAPRRRPPRTRGRQRSSRSSFRSVCSPSMNAVPVSRDRRRETPAPPALWRGHSGGDRLGCASGFREPDGFIQPLTQPRKPGRWVYLAAAAITTLVPPLLGPAQLRTQGGDFGGQNVGEQRRLRDVARTHRAGLGYPHPHADRCR